MEARDVLVDIAFTDGHGMTGNPAPLDTISDLPSRPRGSKPPRGQRQLRKFGATFQRLENLSKQIDRLAAATEEAIAVNERLKKLDARLSAIRAEHDLRQRLFEPLRDELLKYRDAFAREVLQKALVQDLVSLDDDLRNILDCIKRAAEVKRGRALNWARGLDCSMEGLAAILGRLEVSEIEAKGTADPCLHRVVSYEPTDCANEEGKIVAHVRRGLLWRDEVLRREEVIAKRFR